MEQWPNSSILPSHTEAERTHHFHRPVRVLGDSSGNAQTYAQDFKPGTENQIATQDVPDVNLPILAGGQYHFPPAPILPSNDQNTRNLARLHARHSSRRDHRHGHRRHVDEDRPYLRCRKYIDYRSRRRQDTGDDGKPVWDDPMEEAFQNALVVIKPMGRKKKSQNGKPNGRNELIAEWILCETGQTRTRKQVSSHIQVLSQLLRGIPEWDVLVAVPPEDEKNSGSMEYFGNSIQQAVDSRRHSHPHAHGDLADQYSASSLRSINKHQISELSFGMWVSHSRKMEEHLHDYTRLQSNRATAEPMLLEDVKNWRSAYPRLDDIISRWTLSERCDVIMLDASFRLMSKWPPEGSKLGISLELDFLDPSNRNYEIIEGLQVWEGQTTIYDRGRQVGQPAWYENCHSAGPGKVKPFFESRFWASTFTHLTDKRLMAEDSENEAKIEAAIELSRRHLRHLTVIQEIYARSARSPLVPRQRMAILLWRFSEAQPHWPVGITTWQRLVPPPDRMTTNSPPPTQDLDLPLLAMDAVLDTAGNATVLDPDYDFKSQFDPHQLYGPFGYDFDEELCQDGTMIVNHSPGTANQLAAIQASFAMDSMQGTAGQETHSAHQYHFDLPLHDSQYLSQSMEHVVSDNFFESQNMGQEPAKGERYQEQSHIYNEHQHESPSKSGQPLTRFDISTHQTLQEQLEQDDRKRDDIEDEVLRQALVAASAMSDLGHHPNDNQTVVDDTQHIWRTAPPTGMDRPQLQTHPSFTGQNSHDQSHTQRLQHFGDVPDNLVGFNGDQTVAALSADTSHHRTPAHVQQDDWCQRTGNIQSLGMFHLDDGQPPQERYESLGASFVDVKEEAQSQIGAGFVLVNQEDI